MASSNLELVRTVLRLFNEGDLDVVIDRYFDPDVEVEYGGFLLDAHPSYRGHAGVRKLLGVLEEGFHYERAEIEELIEANENVVVGIRYSGHGQTSGITADILSWQVWTIRAGKGVRWRIYTNKAEALAAVGHPA